MSDRYGVLHPGQTRPGMHAKAIGLPSTVFHGRGWLQRVDTINMTLRTTTKCGLLLTPDGPRVHHGPGADEVVEEGRLPGLQQRDSRGSSFRYSGQQPQVRTVAQDSRTGLCVCLGRA